jgi:antitoxin ParD1/3/4
MASKVQKISIALPKEMVDDIRYAVDSGQYATTSEVIREAVREWRGKPRELPARVRVPKTKEEFRKRLRDAIASLDRGEGIPAEKVFARLEAKYAAMAKTQALKKVGK